MKKSIAVITLTIGALLLTGCGESEDYPELREQTEVACWDKHWPTYIENISAGMLTEEEAEGKLARMCIDLGNKAVQEAKETQ